MRRAARGGRVRGCVHVLRTCARGSVHGACVCVYASVQGKFIFGGRNQGCVYLWKWVLGLEGTDRRVPEGSWHLTRVAVTQEMF